MSDLPFTLDQLKILQAIAQEGSFKKAGEKLYISQPAVSLQIQNLQATMTNQQKRSKTQTATIG